MLLRESRVMRPLRLILLNALIVVAGGWMLSFARAAEIDKCPDMIAAKQIFRTALARDQVGVTFVGHATFLIESPGGTTIATDYNDYVRPKLVPTVATMNKAHSTHYSLHPSPAIAHVLRGWNPDGGPIHHDLISATCIFATCRPTFAAGMAAPKMMRTPFSSSRPPGSA